LKFPFELLLEIRDFSFGLPRPCTPDISVL
jgi:hypothetical protein